MNYRRESNSGLQAANLPCKPPWSTTYGEFQYLVAEKMKFKTPENSTQLVGNQGFYRFSSETPKNSSGTQATPALSPHTHRGCGGELACAALSALVLIGQKLSNRKCPQQGERP